MKPSVLAIALAIPFGFAMAARAQAAAPIGFELYSWKAGSDWRYAVLEGTSTPRSAEQIESRQNRLKNLTFLKGRLASLPAKETVYWRRDAHRGFELPSKEIIQQIRDYMEGLQLRLLLPDDIQPGN